MTDHITIDAAPGTWVVRAGGAVIGESSKALELREGGRGPVIYFPRGDVAMAFLDRTGTRTHCQHKGDASYYSIVTNAETLPDVVWSYEDPKDGVAAIREHLAFAPGEVTVERV